ncbi:MAG TPA: indole-3-glycerol-phosphate synthase [Polyangiales bacterium]
MNYLSAILERKRRELVRRRRHRLRTTPAADGGRRDRAERAQLALRRKPGSAPRVIAEIKRRSPSRGELRAYARGDVVEIARAYAAGGAAAVSVLCERLGFGGSPLDLRRAARSVDVPLLFKEFVLDELQIELAREIGADMVLLLVCALEPARLHALVDATHAAGLAPVVEAANAAELRIALQTSATIIGVNARNLGSFQVDIAAAQTILAAIPPDRIAVHMSGVRNRADFVSIAKGRADAVLIGESLMRAADPTRQLIELLRA